MLVKNEEGDDAVATALRYFELPRQADHRFTKHYLLGERIPIRAYYPDYTTLLLCDFIELANYHVPILVCFHLQRPTVVFITARPQQLVLFSNLLKFK